MNRKHIIFPLFSKLGLIYDIDKPVNKTVAI